MNRKWHHLLSYIEQTYRVSRLFNENLKVPTLEDCKEEKVYMTLFLDLSSALSPENLCCDGELRGRALNMKAIMLNGAWADLEKLTGEKFEEYDDRLMAFEEKRRNEFECPQCGYTAHRVHQKALPVVFGEILFNCPNCGDFHVKSHQLLSRTF